MENHSYFFGLKRWVPNIGFGGWQIGGPQLINGKENGWANVNETTAIDLIQEAIEQGLSFFDTAQGYGFGRSEQIIGKALRISDYQNKVIICTKINLERIPVNGNLILHLSKLVDESRLRLNVDCIDILLLHNPDITKISEELKVALMVLQNRGVISTFGLSAKTLDDALWGVKNKFGSVLEWNFSLLERRPVHLLFPLLSSAKMNFIARSPLYRGLITEQFLLSDGRNDFSDNRKNFDNNLLQWVHVNLKEVSSFAQIFNLTISELSLAYSISQKQVSVVIPGIKSKKHLQSIQRLRNIVPEIAEKINDLKFTFEECYPPFK